MSKKSPTISPARKPADDHFTAGEEAFDFGGLILDVHGNDRKNSELWSLDAGEVADLLARDELLAPEQSLLGASIWLTGDGRVGYRMDHARVQSLAEGETLEDSFVYAARLPSGDLVWSTAHVTISGTNDAPKARGDAAAVFEDDMSSGSVAANDVDVDNGAVLGFAAAGPLPAGFAMASDGSWTLDGSDPAYRALGAGETMQLEIPYIVTDEHGASGGATLVLTVTGRNDAPVAEADLGEGREGARTGGSVAANDSDADNGALLLFAPSGAEPAGFMMAPDGSWTLDASGADYDALAEGESVEIAVPYIVTDQHGASSEATLTIRVTGSNDAPVAQADHGLATEDLLATGSVAANDLDPDSGALLRYAVDPSYPAGALPPGFALAPDGSWSLDLADAIWQGLSAGETHQVYIPYIVIDEHGATSGSTLTLQVVGTNDAPVVAGARQDGFMVEDGPAVTGQIGFADPDHLDTHSVTVVRLGSGPALGSIVIDGFEPSGPGSTTRILNWHFAPGAGIQSLEQGEQAIEQFAVTISDGQGGTATQIVTVPILGSGDSPVAGPATAMVMEDTVLQGALSLHASDVDHHSLLTFQAGSLPAGFTLAPNGDWTFDARVAAYQPLNAGQTLNVVVPYTVTDPTGRSASSTLTITVFGSNDAIVTAPPPVFTGTGDPNDFDGLTGGAANNAATITAPVFGGTITGGLAAQTITGSDSPDTIYGGGGNDTIIGRGNNDRLYGQAGNDLLESGWGMDTLYGGSGNDTLRGQTPQQEAVSGTWPLTFYGGSGADILIGGGNNDVLVGGYGADVMTGGGNFDTFVFNSVLDSGDRITDFLFGMDKLDFRGIDANTAVAGDQAFLWSKTGAAANSLWAVRQGTDTVIFADTDGNLATAEFMVTLQNLVWIEPAGVPSGFLL